ncbi:Eco57I restriction-modification methylase domain-containing protein [Novipirellula rosea]|uniref:site-specific DNA-methyltransferase (adenine-specific) n=1 Tax=Novipirellula rosea TaxID=1031540 RepID=A0ABP8M9E9_9BACT
MQALPLFKDEYLFSIWEDEFHQYAAEHDAQVVAALTSWDSRDKDLTERQLDGLFVTKLFRDLWGYEGTGTTDATDGYTLLSEYSVPGAGQRGGTGKADLALGNFGMTGLCDVPQVLCEFKDINSGLDAPQKRKGNDRSPVQQCLDYLKYAFDKTEDNQPVKPTWGIVSDMNEFRLYFRKAGDAQCQRFVIASRDEADAMLGVSETAIQKRFLFWKLFSSGQLITDRGQSELEKILGRQWTLEKSLERDFYKEYQAYRQHVYESILEANPNFAGTRGELVRITQRFLDRCIFLLFCEDMGKALSFPTDLLRDILIRESCSPTYSGDFDNIWALVKQLFNTMRDGGVFPPNHQIHKFNGGLFENLQTLENLRVPNRIFCAQGQGESKERLAEFKNTLLYLSATYNFGATSAGRERTITLYALGRIFEQSITDLEYMRAEADGVPTVAKLSKRRRDGVYYTPEWVTIYIVQHVIGRRLEEERERIGLVLGQSISEDDLKKYRKARTKPKTNPATIHVKKLDQYEEFLDHVTVLDPACGSGAFLIQALQYLQQHRRDIAVERERITGAASLFDQDAIIRSILSDNLYGVDINPESVEITQLALWLNTASPGKPLSTLDQNIQCGNSLVGDGFAEFYNAKHKTLFDDADPAEREKVNAFDWSAAFPKILGPDVDKQHRGFDCVIGNPPYVKLQHFRKVVPDVAEFLSSATTVNETDGSSVRLYDSTRSKNYDLYLPFIERGLSLLNPSGHLGYIAPSVWLLNEYGVGLKSLLKRSQRLNRWVDFKDFPVFDEAMTYTALQFYRGSPSKHITFAACPDGQLATVEDVGTIPYESLDADDTWVFLPDNEQNLIDRLKQKCSRLDEHSAVETIFQGLVTSADYIFQLERVGPKQYRQTGSKADGILYDIEDELMKPLVSGVDAKRYLEPNTTTYLLFPYDVRSDDAVLWSSDEMYSRFPKGWEYLKRYESDLRGRENGKMDRDHDWWGYVYPKSLGKHELAKLGVATTVPEMRVFLDSEGRFYFNNVRVNGILVKPSHAWFLLGILNSRVADFVFRRISKPKEPRPSGAYFEANKQYIAPIPIPSADDSQTKTVASAAQRLQTLHTQRRDIIEAIDQRFASRQMVDKPKPPSWIWADVFDVAHWKKANPEGLRGRALSAWSKSHYESLLDKKYETVEDQITFGDTMMAAHEDGQLKFFIGGRCVIDGIYVTDDEANVILPQWQQKARDSFVSESMNAKRIVTRLLDLRTTSNPALTSQLADFTKKLADVESKILSEERALDDFVYDLYGIDPDSEDRVIIETDTARRADARFPRRKE